MNSWEEGIDQNGHQDRIQVGTGGLGWGVSRGEKRNDLGSDIFSRQRWQDLLMVCDLLR